MANSSQKILTRIIYRKEALQKAVAATATANPALKMADAAKKKSPEQPEVANKKPRSLKAQIIEFISEFLKYVALFHRVIIICLISF